ncbi:glycosyltransferase [Fluviibacterium sp. DFM31]|uniref:Glycosyltransferase n=2 Tax=Meridianimarinicoccus marinus TaxID=3231483 RepID=A0ABV3L401_9RHOB
MPTAPRRILVTSTPLAGHINPTIPYARALQAAGHEVCYATTQNLRDKIEKHGFSLAPMPEPTKEAAAPTWAALDACGPDEVMPIAFREMFGRVWPEAYLPVLLDKVADWQPHLIVRESMDYSGLIAGEKASIPTACVSITASGLLELFRPEADIAINGLRNRFGVPRANWRVWTEEPIVTPFPPELDTAGLATQTLKPMFVAPDGPATTPLHGDESWMPAEGTPLIYLTLGTVSGRSEKVQAVYRQLLEAVATLPVQALLTTGPIMDPSLLGTIPDNVQVAEFVPQTKVFSVASVVVNHGGSGTYLGCLAAGLPQVVIPLFADQPVNARSLQASGAGLSVPDPNPSRIRDAITSVLDDPAYRDRANAISMRMAAMQPMDRAVARLVAHSG